MVAFQPSCSGTSWLLSGIGDPVTQHSATGCWTTSLNFEEFYTVLSQIEACLHASPITVLSNNPNVLQPLTPGHFLIGLLLNYIPGPNLLQLKPNLLTRWQLLQRLVQYFWKRRSFEYLNRLQQRSEEELCEPTFKQVT
jgi:hypothetical protein